MSADADQGEGPVPIDDRTQRALQGHMVVYPDDPAVEDWEVAVYSGGERYAVDPSVPACNCDDMVYRRPADGCKHVRRVLLTADALAIPAWADRGAIDDVLLRQRAYCRAGDLDLEGA